jgi:hypothetical protein
MTNTSDTPPTHTPAQPRTTLEALAAAGTDQLLHGLHRALPGNDGQKPGVAAFNSSI